MVERSQQALQDVAALVTQLTGGEGGSDRGGGFGAGGGFVTQTACVGNSNGSGGSFGSIASGGVGGGGAAAQVSAQVEELAKLSAGFEEAMEDAVDESERDLEAEAAAEATSRLETTEAVLVAEVRSLEEARSGVIALQASMSTLSRSEQHKAALQLAELQATFS